MPCFTSESDRKMVLKSLQSNRESAFSHSSIRWMQDDHELSNKYWEETFFTGHEIKAEKSGSGDAALLLVREGCGWTWLFQFLGGVAAAVILAGEGESSHSLLGAELST